MRDALISGPRGLRLLARVPQSRRERARGLLDRSTMTRDEALLLMRARSVHTFGMRFAIKVALLDVDGLVGDVLLVQPGRVVLPRATTRHILELRADLDVRPGDRLTVSPPVTRSPPGPSFR